MNDFLRPSISIFAEYKNALGKYVDFKGRSRPREFWSFALLNIPLLVVASVISPDFAMVLWIALLVPYWAAVVRRLHDTNRSGWYFLISIIPFVGGLVLIFWLCQPSTSGYNSYGADSL